jgi:hypothetical protein
MNQQLLAQVVQLLFGKIITSHIHINLLYVNKQNVSTNEFVR